MNRSSLAEATIRLSQLKLSVLTCQLREDDNYRIIAKPHENHTLASFQPAPTPTLFTKFLSPAKPQ